MTISDVDRRTVESTLRDLPPVKIATIRAIHEKSLEAAILRRDRLRGQLAAAERAIGMRELALELLDGMEAR